MSQYKFRPFKPHPLFRGGHVQTIAGAYLANLEIPQTQSVERVVSLTDGDSLLLMDDTPATGWEANGDVAILLHGVCGSSESTYIRRLSAKLQQRGVRTFRVNMRGCGPGRGLAKNLYHAGRSEDLQAVVDTVRSLCPESKVKLCGFSLGGNILLKWLGESPEIARSLVDKAIAVNPPVCLSTCTKSIGRIAFGWYDRYFANLLYRQLLHAFDKNLDQSRFPLPKRVVDFDEMFTAPRNGYLSAQEYYESCAAAQFVPQIRVPTLIISAQDDPLVPARTLSEITLPDEVQLHLAKAGGHLGYYGKAGVDADRWWIDWRVIEWLIDHVSDLPKRPAGNFLQSVA